MALPANVDTGLVTGRFLVGVIDGPDPDDEPDGLPAQGTITFTASVPYLPNPTADPAPVTILKAPIVGILDSEGYLCVRKPDGTAGARGVRLVATDDPDLAVQGWTWTVTYTFENVNGVTPRIATHSMALPTDAIVDLTSVMKVPSSTGIGVEQAEALAAAAAGAALRAEAAAAAVADATLPHTSVVEHGAKGDGATDDTAAVQAALVAGAGGNVYFAPGAYRLTANLNVPAGTTITGAGSAATLLDWSTKAAFDSWFFLSWGQGVFTDATTPTVDAVPGDVSVTVPTGHAFQVGDWIRLRADNILWGEATPAEYQRVLIVEGNVLTLSGPVFDTYLIANNAVIEKAVLPSGGIQGLTIRGKGINPTGYGDTAVHAGLVRDFFAHDVHFYDVENKCLLLNSVLVASISDCVFRFDPSFTPLQYGVAVTGGCQMITVRGCSAWNDRHMFTTSTSKSLNSEYRGIPRVLTVTGCTAHGSWQAPIDTHRGGEYITITGNSVNSESVGVKIRGAKAVITGNSIVGKRVSKGGGARGLYIGMVAEDVLIAGNLISGFEDGIRIDTTDPTSRNIGISDNSIINCARGVYLGATARVDQVQVSGNTMRPIDGGVGVFFFAAAADVEIVGNTITGGHTAIFMSHPTNRVDRLMVNGNTCRQQTTRAMFFRWVYDGLVTSNFAPGREIRFTDTCERVTTGLNQAVIADMTTGTTIVQK